MRRFLLCLMSGNNNEVDAVEFCMVVGFLSLLGMAAYMVYTHPETTGLQGVATSLLMMIGAGGIKTARDRWSAPPAITPDEPPKP